MIINYNVFLFLSMVFSFPGFLIAMDAIIMVR